MTKIRLQKPNVSNQDARDMLRRAEAVEANTYPQASKGYAVCVLTDKGNIYEIGDAVCRVYKGVPDGRFTYLGFVIRGL